MKNNALRNYSYLISNREHSVSANLPKMPKILDHESLINSANSYKIFINNTNETDIKK